MSHVGLYPFRTFCLDILTGCLTNVLTELLIYGTEFVSPGYQSAVHLLWLTPQRSKQTKKKGLKPQNFTNNKENKVFMQQKMGHYTMNTTPEETTAKN